MRRAASLLGTQLTGQLRFSAVRTAATPRATALRRIVTSSRAGQSDKQSEFLSCFCDRSLPTHTFLELEKGINRCAWASGTGTVKWFNVSKGYGFITPTDGSSDIFVHQTQIVCDGFRSLAEGESVEYDLTEDTNGRLRATNVTGPDGAQPVGTPKRSGYNDGGWNRESGRDYR